MIRFCFVSIFICCKKFAWRIVDSVVVIGHGSPDCLSVETGETENKQTRSTNDWWTKFTKNQKCNLCMLPFKILQSVSTVTPWTFFLDKILEFEGKPPQHCWAKYCNFLSTLSLDTYQVFLPLKQTNYRSKTDWRYYYKQTEGLNKPNPKIGFMVCLLDGYSYRSWWNTIIIDFKMTGLKRKWDRIIIIWFKLLGSWGLTRQTSNESDSERREQMT